jgi:hypothetical protein
MRNRYVALFHERTRIRRRRLPLYFDRDGSRGRRRRQQFIDAAPAYMRRGREGNEAIRRSKT